MNQEKEIGNKLSLNIKFLALSLIYVRFCFKAEELKLEENPVLMSVDSDFNRIVNIVCSADSENNSTSIKKLWNACNQFLTDLKELSKIIDYSDKEFGEIMLEAEKTVNKMCKNIKTIKEV